MPEHDPERLPARWETLTPLGRLIFLGGAAARVGAEALDGVLRRAASLVVDTQQAFLEGRGDDPAQASRIEEARVVREERRPPAPRRG